VGHSANCYFLAVACAAAFACFLPNGGALASVANAGVHEGVATCSGSACHGRLIKRDHGVWLNEIHVWQDISSPAGAHGRAWQVLEGVRAEGIARRLGLASAKDAPICLGCHTDPGEARGPEFQVSDGVGCEACHGGSKSWLASHYALNTPHPVNVAHGMVALEDPQVRAAVCLDCHFGGTGKNQFVTHAMMAAGHPRISFELDLFSELQRHYSLDADYARRKPIAGGTKTWAVGQAVALDRALTLYAGEKGGGVFPEFYFFDCHSCHRAISAEPEAQPRAVANPARPLGVGVVPFNDSSVIMLSAALRVVAPDWLARFDSQARAFELAVTQSREEATTHALELAATAHQVATILASRTFTPADTLAILNTLVSDNLAARYTDYVGSEQAVMAIDTLRHDLVMSHTISKGEADAMQPDIERLYAATHDPNLYRPVEFRALLQRLAVSFRALHT
jgi:hypothetical protein